MQQPPPESPSLVEKRDAENILGTYKRTSFHPRAGKGREARRRGGKGLLGPPRRHRRERARPPAPAPREGASRGGEPPSPRLEPLLPPGAGAPRRAPHAALRDAARLLLQQRHGGDRGRGEVHAPRDAGAKPDARARGRLPRAHDGRARAHGQRGVPQAVRAARRRDRLPSAERRRRPREAPSRRTRPRSSWSRSSAKGASSR